jgi:dephospho-CoA kinase
MIFKEALGERRANIHVRIKGRANERYARLFRDYLSYHFDSARCYQQFKETVAKYTDGGTAAYSDIKDPFCDLIMIAALNWADESSWKP